MSPVEQVGQEEEVVRLKLEETRTIYPQDRVMMEGQVELVLAIPPLVVVVEPVLLDRRGRGLLKVGMAGQGQMPIPHY
jgi:hypothetical protein